MSSIKSCLFILDPSFQTLELRFLTLLAGKTESKSAVICAKRLFSLYLEENKPEARIKILRVSYGYIFFANMRCEITVCQVFNELQRNDCDPLLSDLLNSIPWKTDAEWKKRTTVPFPARIRWICAEVAIRSCLRQQYPEGCYQWLEEIACWDSSKEALDPESLLTILVLAEREAIKLSSPHTRFNWFVVLVKVYCRHGIKLLKVILPTKSYCVL